jgi:hypothetical protein
MEPHSRSIATYEPIVDCTQPCNAVESNVGVVLHVTRSGYYAWLDRPASPKTIADAQLPLEIKAALTRGRGAYGSPRIHRELRAHRIRVARNASTPDA